MSLNKQNGQKIKQINLADEAKRRYLNYALSVVTSRALPDVRDGLKPVQRRILYAMYKDFSLNNATKYRKSAAVVGRVIGAYHPHGDQSVYAAMVRMAQSFSLRYPLVDGHGNFGSLDGDPAAAYRYTEVKLEKITNTLLQEINQKTVPLRDNFDGSSQEPIILPAQIPNLLINGSNGIAVGMATNIPPHNLGEVIDACLELIYDPDISTDELLKIIKGPDFPTGGEIITTKKELSKIYEKGQGSIKIRSTYKTKNNQVIIDTIPFNTNKSLIIEQIANIICENKVPGLNDVRDESTEIVRIVLDITSDTTTEKVMAYLYRHTQLEINYSLNMMCLIPGNSTVQPKRLSLKDILLYFLDFRMEIITQRFANQLNILKKRIHILEGLEFVFDYLDEAFDLIKSSKSKETAIKKIQSSFTLDKIQAEAILEIKLQSLVKIEKTTLIKELKQKTKDAKKLEKLLGDEDARWNAISDELEAIADEFDNPRRTKIKHNIKKQLKYDPTEYIKDEDTNVILTHDGWMKRIQHFKDPKSIATRKGDKVVAILPGNTRECVAFFSNFGICYTMLIQNVPMSGRGHGSPIQKFFTFKDGERIVGALSLDKRYTPEDLEVEEDEIPPPYLIAITLKGQILRFPLQKYRQISQKVGRRFCRLTKEDKVIKVFLTRKAKFVGITTKNGRGILFDINEISVITSPGKGVIAIRLKEDDIIFNAKLLNNEDSIIIKTKANNIISFGPQNYKINKRATTGVQIFSL
jgi:DNA gyrase subunit A